MNRKKTVAGEDNQSPDQSPIDASSSESTSTGKNDEHAADNQASIQSLAAERDELKDKYLRTLAEMDNYRKRIKKEKEEYQRFVLTDFLLDILPVFDNLERALKAKDSQDQSGILAGVEMIQRQMAEILKKNNVVEIEAQGQPFDPAYHQALAKEEKDDVREATVVEVYQKGFIYQDKLLRPALIKVVVPAQQKSVDDTAIERNTDVQ